MQLNIVQLHKIDVESEIIMTYWKELELTTIIITEFVSNTCN